jgi:DNA modification methylase
MRNTLYYGDNLAILQEHIPDESVDLVYLDPPFNSSRDYKAAMGFFICLDTLTKGMYQEADELGFFDSPSGRKIPKLQIRTIKQLLEDTEFDFPKGWSLRSGTGKKLTRYAEQSRMDL